MGFNTTVVLWNDCFEEIRRSPNFGEEVVAAALKAGCYRAPADIYSLGCVGIAVETHHADVTTLVAVGGNLGRELVSVPTGWRMESSEIDERILRELAHKLGYDLRKRKT